MLVGVEGRDNRRVYGAEGTSSLFGVATWSISQANPMAMTASAEQVLLDQEPPRWD